MNDPIRHVVVLMLENRSFDHLLGDLDQKLLGLEGVKNAQAYVARHPSHIPGDPAPLPFSGNAKASLDAKSLGEAADFDPSHEFLDVKAQLGGDLAAPVMNGFAADAYEVFKTKFKPETLRDSISQAMAYFPLNTSATGAIPVLQSLAQQFVVCDHWFASIPGPTWPNRFFAVAGTTKGNLRMPEGVATIPTLFRHYDMDTIFNRLHDAGKRSRIYYHDISLSLLLRQTWDIPDLRQRFSGFAADVAQAQPNDFPEFVFIEPRFFQLPFADKPNDQHPPHDIGLGDQLIADVYAALSGNQALWRETLLVVVYDEHGGFFDHVAPPPALPPDDWVAPKGPDGDLGFGFDRLGVRVPAVLASPWLQPGIDHAVYDHSSLLAYVCNKWQLPALGARCQAEMLKQPFSGLFQASPRAASPVLTARAMGAERALAQEAAAPAQPNGNQLALAYMVDFLADYLGVGDTEPGARALLSPQAASADGLLRKVDKIEARLSDQARASALLQAAPTPREAAGPIKVWMVHGVGHQDAAEQQAWKARWEQAFSASARQAGCSRAFQFQYADYDAVFQQYPLDAWTIARGLAALAAGALTPQDDKGLLDGLDQMESVLRWTAGMTLQWVENADLRAALAATLRQQFDAFQPDLVCAHSLGSMACYELFRRMVAGGEAAALNGRGLLTFGSQLANPAVRQALGGRLEPLYDADGQGISQWFQLYNPLDRVFTWPLPWQDARSHVLTQSFSDPPLNHDGAVYLAQSRLSGEALPQLLPLAAPAPRSVQALLPAAARTRRRALLVGINAYPKPEMRLNGCVNDVYLMSSVLQECGFAADDIRVLSDERATRDALLERLDWLADGVGPGDERVFFYSGHGAELPHYGADGQPDRSDETLVPVDFDWQPEHAFTDKEFYRYYSQLPYDANFVAIFDCCYAGGMARGGRTVRGIDPPDDVRHRMLRWEPRHQMWVPRDFAEQAAQAGRAFLPDRAAPADAIQLRRHGLGEAKALWTDSEPAFKAATAAYGHAGPYVPLLLFAAGQAELASEYNHGAAAYGAFTFTLAKRLRAAAQPLSFAALIAEVRQELQALGYQQTPTLSGHPDKMAALVPAQRWKQPG